jgi:hypothetical protein
LIRKSDSFINKSHCLFARYSRLRFIEDMCIQFLQSCDLSLAAISPAQNPLNEGLNRKTSLDCLRVAIA